MELTDITNDEINELLGDGNGTSEEYYNRYIRFIHKRKNRGLKKSLINNVDRSNLEIHHIIPRCMGGCNLNDNLVLLSTKEHIIAHILLSLSFPDNISLKYASDCMTTFLNTRKETWKTLIAENKFVDRIKHLTTRSIPIVCLDDNFKILKVYKNTLEAREEGFSSIWGVINGVYNKTGGYHWAKLEDILDTHAEELEEYLKHPNVNSIKKLIKKKNSLKPNYYRLDYKKHGTSLVICDKSGNINYIFDTIEDVSQFDVGKSCISKFIDTNIEIYGVFIYSLDKYKELYPENLKKFDKSKQVSPGFINVKPHKEKRVPIACLDNNGNIIRIYDKISLVVKDGFSGSSVSSAINFGNKSSETKMGKYLGLNWRKLETIDPSKIKEYRDLENSNKLLQIPYKFKIKIIRCSDEKGTIEEIYDSLGSIKKDKLIPQNLFRHMKTDQVKHRVTPYHKSYWYSEEQYELLFHNKTSI